MANSLIVYTAVSNNYDYILPAPVVYNPDTPFVAFLEHAQDAVGWECRFLEKCSDDPNRNAKRYKMLPHLFLPDTECSLWIDGSITIDAKNPLVNLIDKYLQNVDLAIYQHPVRTCIYQEANACMCKRLDDSQVILKQVARYTKEGYPANAGLVEATILLRRHTPQMQKFDEMWWEEICNNSRRDQLSFGYVARKVGLSYAFIEGNCRDAITFHKRNHRTIRVLI